MSTMCDSVARQWMALSAARLRWALDAYHEFVASLHDEIKDRFVQNDGTEAYVVVFGRTQVGKTTLLLELMGVLPASLERVSLVLRGGREMGKSATSTAMEYRRSPDHHWRLRMHDGTDKVYENDAGMTAALADVREAMSEGRLQAERPLALAIPDDCFMSDTVHVRQERIRILDLPGDNPKDLAERHHVERMAQTYVPNADLILLVGRADDLSFLNPAALSLHSIRDWRLVPERFRIITTYSFTLASVREKLRLHEGPADAGYFRQALRQEIATFGLDDVESLPAQLFFPLEFGQSWQQAAHQGLELVDRIGPVIAALKDELMRDIRESATEYGRLRSATQVNVIAKRVKEERLKRWNTSLEKRLEDETTLDAQLTHQQKLVAQLDDARQEHARFMTLVQGLVLPDALSVEAMPDAYTKPGKSRDRFTIEIGKRKEALVRHAVKTVELSMCSLFHMGEPVLEEVGAGIEFDVTGLRQCIADAYRELLARLDGYVIDGYHTWTFMSAYEEDIRLLRQSTRDAEAAIVSYVARHWDRTLGGLRSSAVTEHAKADGAHRQHASLAGKLAETLDGIRQALRDDQQARDAFAVEMDREAQAGDRFAALLAAHYTRQFTACRQQAREARTPAQGLIKLLAARQLMDEKRKVMMGEL